MNTLNETSVQPWWTALFDRFGAAASSLCAIHCLCLPWALIAFPFVADSILANQTAERAFIGVSVLLAACCGVLACRKHGAWWPVGFIAAGAALLVASQVSAPPNCCSEPFGWRAWVAALGGGALAASHAINIGLARRRGAAGEACCSNDGCKFGGA